MTTQSSARLGVVEPHWRTNGDYRVQCSECPWMQIERIRKTATKAAKFHVEEFGHAVELHRKQYKFVRPEALRDLRGGGVASGSGPVPKSRCLEEAAPSPRETSSAGTEPSVSITREKP